MVRLADDEIRNHEVLGYTGIHLFHYPMSSCSQKTRIVLNLKRAHWTPHLVDLSTSENNGARFLGINPRGLVPVLVVDGAVYIESNDILAEIERLFPEPVLFPRRLRSEIDRRLREEDDLHIDLRTLSFRFCYGRTASTKPAEALEGYRSDRAGTPDPQKQKEIEFYDRIARDGITDAAIRTAAGKFRRAFAEWEERLAGSRYLLADDFTVVDVAWYVYAKRLSLGGYPLATLHPRVATWFAALDARSEFLAGLAMPDRVVTLIADNRRQQQATGTTMVEIAGLA